METAPKSFPLLLEIKERRERDVQKIRGQEKKNQSRATTTTTTTKNHNKYAEKNKKKPGNPLTAWPYETSRHPKCQIWRPAIINKLKKGDFL